jgi:hypothetical protein
MTSLQQRQKLYQFLDCHGATKRPLAMTAKNMATTNKEKGIEGLGACRFANAE